MCIDDSLVYNKSKIFWKKNSVCNLGTFFNFSSWATVKCQRMEYLQEMFFK